MDCVIRSLSHLDLHPNGVSMKNANPLCNRRDPCKQRPDLRRGVCEFLRISSGGVFPTRVKTGVSDYLLCFKATHYSYNIMALYPLNFIKSVVRQAFDTGEGSHTTPKLDEQ